MANAFDEFLKSIDGITFEETSDEDYKKLMDLFSDTIPDMLAETYKKHIPAEDAESGEIVFYGIKRIIEENTDYVPGANIHPLGLYTFASSLDGDSICFDSNDPLFPVYQCSPDLIGYEDEISFYKGGMKSLPFDHDSVLKVSARLSDSFEEFVTALTDDDIELFSVSEMIKDL